ncbi:transcriptional regulator, partial [Bifidobacterium longum]|nr:transcriptional regulator [Bifidobacterium longum]
ALEQEEYVDLEAKPLTIATGRPIDELTAMRMRKKLEAQRLQRATA